jgi:hypothetical protein
VLLQQILIEFYAQHDGRNSDILAHDFEDFEFSDIGSTLNIIKRH